MRNILLTLVFLSFFIAPVLAYTPGDSLILSSETTIRIDSIMILGNDQTEDFIILRELTFIAGDEIDANIIQFNKERVFSLGLFNYVNIFVRQADNLFIAVIDVKESWYIYPIPFIKLRENGLRNSSYGINLLIKNFRGRNESLRAITTFGYDPSYYLLYVNPDIGERGQNIFFQSEFLKGRTANRSLIAETITGEEFDYEVLFFGIGAGKRLNLFNSISVVLNYSSYQTELSSGPGITASGSNIDKAIMVGLGYLFDSRDLVQFPRNGIYSKVDFFHKGFGLNRINYNIFNIDFREYRKVFESITAKWRLLHRSTFGKLVPFYDKSYLGFDEYIRGHRFTEKEGDNLILGSFEFGIPIIDEWNLSLDLPVIPQKLTSARIGFYLSVFSDHGFTYNHGFKFDIDSVLSGWGFGITVLVLPYNALRFEYAFDEFMNPEMIIGTGFSF
ncbi:MAG: hypothetical protein K9G57_01525 [Ignavibacteriales bacterium]|nr:hypothetical protein [Ignavibacteriales bacterium]